MPNLLYVERGALIGLALFTAIVLTGPLYGQRIERVSHPSDMKMASPRGIDALREFTPGGHHVEIVRAKNGTHWQSGLIAGAVLGALAANLLLDPGASGGKRIGVTLAGATPLGVIGAMVGGLFPKGADNH